MKNRKNILSLLTISAFALISLAACAGSTTVKFNQAEGEQPESQDEPFGITQRENDLDDYEDLRPDREYFEDNTEPDTGVLVDHIFEFEEMNGVGSSRNKDHYCSAVSYVCSGEFSGNIAVENVDVGNSFSLNLTSDKAVKVPMIIGLNNNYHSGGTLGEVVNVKNNGKPVFDPYAVIPSEGNPAEGAPSGYFNMVAVESTLSLVEGENRIVFTLTDNSVNLDYVNLKTSATIVNNTISAWDDAKFEVTSAPTLKQSGTLSVTCGNADCVEPTIKNNLYLPNLSDSSYKVVDEEEYMKAYYLTLAGQDILIAKINNDPALQFPEDTGELKDHIFEFEKAKIDGVSQNEEHLCPAKSLVVGSDFGNGLCIEALEDGTKMSFTITSDKRVRVPFVMHANNYHKDQTLGAAIDGTINGDKSLVDLSNIIPANGKNANVGGLSYYFNMVDIQGTFDLVKGENVIELTTKGTGMNFDYLNIKTSANIVDNTVATWKDESAARFEVTQPATYIDTGIMKAYCPIGGGEFCERTFDYIPALRDASYTPEKEGDKYNYYIEIDGKKYLVGTIDNSPGVEYPLDCIGTKPYKFEFESSAITGISQFAEDHFCAIKSLVYSSGFSNSFCMENSGLGTKFEFVINSDKAVQAVFELRATDSLSGKPLNNMIKYSNNGKSEMFDASRVVTNNGFTPDVGETLSRWFKMVDGVGTVNLVKGENRIVFETADYGVNPDCFTIFSSANLVNKTTPTWSGDYKPTFTLKQAPTDKEKGKMEIGCPHKGCTFEKRVVDYLPLLTSDAYELLGNTYYLNLFGVKLEVAKKEA